MDSDPPNTSSPYTSSPLFASTFAGAIQTYHEQVQQLKKTDGSCAASDDQAILALLRSRDRIQFFLDQSANQPEITEIPPALLITLSNDDACLGRWSPQFTAIAPYANWRKSLNPPDHHWWWPPAPVSMTDPSQPWIDWVLGGLTIALLTVCLALAKDISTRFLTGAPGIWSSIGAITPAALALFATGGALTKVGKQLIDTFLVSTWKVAHHSPWIKLGLAAVLTVLFFIGHFQGLPWAATRYHATGEKQYYTQGKLASAQGNFQRALQLNPNFPEANHSLALTYEDLRNFERAKAEYVKAVNAGLLTSVNNLARLQIKEEQDYESAAVLLLTALQNKERDREDATLEYGLRKNLGWAWLEQKRLLKAQGELIKANRLEASLPEPRPDAYCLLAKVLEQQESLTEAQAEWAKCRQKISRPEDDVWAAMADEALAYTTPSAATPASKLPITPPTTTPSTEEK